MQQNNILILEAQNLILYQINLFITSSSYSLLIWQINKLLFLGVLKQQSYRNQICQIYDSLINYFMFKSNPFKEQFQRYDGKTIKTLEIKNFKFISPNQIQQNLNRNKIHFPKSNNAKLSNQKTGSAFKTILIHPQNNNCVEFDSTFSIQSAKNKTKIGINKNPQIGRINKTKYKEIKKVTNPAGLDLAQLSQRHQVRPNSNTALSLRQQKFGFLGDSKFSVFNNRTIAQPREKLMQQKRLKQKLYKSIDFDNLFQKIQSNITPFHQTKSPQSSPKIKDQLILLDKIKRYSKTPNFKARTVFDQFNLRYLINKKKKFNIKNQTNIKGSHLPYFQSFNSNQSRSLSKIEKRQANVSLGEKLDRKSPKLQEKNIEPSRKVCSFIVIDDGGIVHEQKPEWNPEDRRDVMEKISSKVINMRQLLRIQRIQASSCR